MPKLREELQFTSLDEQEIIRPKEGVSLYYKNGVMKVLHASGEEQTLLAGEDANIDLSQYYTRIETDNAIANAIAELGPTGFEVVVVQSRPQVGESGKLYLVPDSTSTENSYLEFIYVNNKWELIGSTQTTVDLSQYAKKDEVDELVDEHISGLDLATGTRVEQVNTNIENYKTTVSGLLNEKVSVGSVYTKTEVYTKSEIDSKFDQVGGKVAIREWTV